MKALLFIFLVAVNASALADTMDSGVYYAAEKSFNTDDKFESRLGAGWDFSNPYLNVYSLQAAGYYLLDSNIAAGVEGTVYTTTNRGSFEDIKRQFSTAGLAVSVNKPQYKFAAAFRVTPISGLVNLLSSKIVKANVNIVGRAGVVQYSGRSLGPVFGAGLETQIEITPHAGVFTQIAFDFEKPGSDSWQGRTGFLIGPTFRF